MGNNMNIERCVEMLKNGGFRERHDAMNVMVKSDDIPMSEIEASLSASFERKDMGTFLCLTGVILSKGGSGVLRPYMGDPKVRNLVVSMVLRQAAGVYAAQKMKDKMQSENNKDNVPPYCHRPVDFSVEKEIEHALKEIGEHEDSIMSKEVKAKFSLKQPLVLFGKTFHEALKRIEVELTIAALMRSKKVFVIAGPSGSGKTMLLNSVLDRFRKTDSWVVKQCSRYLRSGENKNEKLSLYYVDDADTSRIHEAGDLMVLMNEQNNYLLVTCRDPEWPESFFGDFPRRTFNVPVPDWLDIENYLMERKVGSCFLSMESVKSSVKYLREFSPEPSFRTAADLWEELVANLMREDIMRGKKICSGAVSFTDEAVREAAEKDLLVRNNDDSDKEKNTKEIIISLEDIGRRIVGQDNVIDGVMPYLKSAVLGLSGKNRPAGVFFFYGPTGCGKSELGKVIADLLFQGRIQREDMNTYVDHHSIARIMGSPPGYLGCFSVSPFLTFLSENMNGVILLDEIEKSHPVVMDFIMEALDTGWFTDASGNQYDARQYIIIMTSNVSCNGPGGMDTVGFNCGDGYGKIDDRGILMRTQRFRPEFISRIDVIARFNPLTVDACRKIAGSMYREMLDYIVSAGHHVAFDEACIDEIAGSYDERTGARSMRHYLDTVVKKQIVDKLCMRMYHKQNIQSVERKHERTACGSISGSSGTEEAGY